MTNTKTNAIDEIKAKLEQGITDVMTSDNYRAWLDTISKFHKYSFYNQILITMQKPEATRVAGFNTWKSMERHINKGEKAIKIIAPIPHKYTKLVKDVHGNETEEELTWCSFKVVSVFDISQTSGKELPSMMPKQVTEEVENFADVVEALKKATSATIVFEPMDGETANGFYHCTSHEIHVKNTMPEAMQIKTLAHEIAHSIMHHNDMETDRNIKEMQAESVAYIVSNYLGIDTSDYSFNYVAGWSGEKDTKTLKAEMSKITDTAKKIINLLEKVA